MLLISPKESAGLTGVVEKAIDAKIPVIVLDRNVDTKRITQFIGGDNALIGRAAGEHAVKLLGGPGKAQGNVVEIWGGMGTAAGARPARRLPRLHRQGKWHQISAQQSVRRLEAGSRPTTS